VMTMLIAGTPVYTHAAQILQRISMTVALQSCAIIKATMKISLCIHYPGPYHGSRQDATFPSVDVAPGGPGPGFELSRLPRLDNNIVVTRASC